MRSMSEAVETRDETAAAAEASPYASIEAPPPGAATADDLDGAESDSASERPADPSRLDLVFAVPVRLSVELGRTELPIREVVTLGRGSVIELDKSPGDTLDVRVNGVLIGRGEIVVVNEERLGLRFIEVVSQAERVKRLS